MSMPSSNHPLTNSTNSSIPIQQNGHEVHIIKKEQRDDGDLRIKREPSLPPPPPPQKESLTTPIPTSNPSRANGAPSSSFPGQVNAIAGPSTPPKWQKELDLELINKKRKWGLMGYGDDEIELLEEESINLNLALLLDQTSTLYPEPPTSFTSYEDVVDRLLPYHIWQVHDEELEGQGVSRKEEMNEIRDAQELVGRIRGLKDRFGKARRREGEHPSHLPSLISIYQQSNQITKEEISSLQTILRPLNAEYAAIENEWLRIENEKKRVREEKIRIEENRLRAIEMEKKRIENEQKQKEEEKQRIENEKRRMEDEARKKLIEQKRIAEENRKVHPSTSTPAPTSSNSQIPTNPPGIVNGTLPVNSATPASVPTAARIPPAQFPTATPQTYPPQATTTTPSTPSTIGVDRGRPRGRPRGRGRGGASEPSVTHLNSGGVINPNTPSPATSSTSLPPGASLNRPSPTPNTPGTPGTAPTPVANKGPVALTINTALIPQLVALGILSSSPPTPNTPKPLANIIKTLDDKKHVVITVDLGQLSKNQLLQLAKLLNVSTGGKPPTAGNGTTNGPTPSSSSANAPISTTQNVGGNGISSQVTQPSASTSSQDPK